MNYIMGGCGGFIEFDRHYQWCDDMVQKKHNLDEENFMLIAIILCSNEKNELKTDFELFDVINMVKLRGFES